MVPLDSQPFTGATLLGANECPAFIDTYAIYGRKIDVKGLSKYGLDMHQQAAHDEIMHTYNSRVGKYFSAKEHTTL